MRACVRTLWLSSTYRKHLSEATLVRLFDARVTGLMWKLIAHSLRNTWSQVRLDTAPVRTMASFWHCTREGFWCRRHQVNSYGVRSEKACSRLQYHVGKTNVARRVVIQVPRRGPLANMHLQHLIDRGNRLFARYVSWCRFDRLPLRTISYIF